jgi:hypothetical protein
VVGDDAKRSILFRAATVENILGFASRYTTEAKVVALEQNYRSTQWGARCRQCRDRRGRAAISQDLAGDARTRRAAALRKRVADDQAQADYVVARFWKHASAACR